MTYFVNIQKILKILQEKLVKGLFNLVKWQDLTQNGVTTWYKRDIWLECEENLIKDTNCR